MRRVRMWVGLAALTLAVLLAAGEAWRESGPAPWSGRTPLGPGLALAQGELAPRAFLPWLRREVPTQALPNVPTVNVPRFDGPVENNLPEAAVFWLGRVTPTDNYADVVVGYNSASLYVRVAVFDRLLWYDTTPALADLTNWDAVTLFLDTAGHEGSAPRATSYRFVSQLRHWQNAANYQAAYRGNGTTWGLVSVPFTTSTPYRGGAGPNSGGEDRGWAAEYWIPFSSLGMSGPPAPGTQWGLSVRVHDRDDVAGTAIADQVWPPSANGVGPATWGRMRFGLPSYQPPASTPRQTVTIRHGLNGAVVPDAAVGGTLENLCPGDSYFIWNQWGQFNFGDGTGLNIQNQSDISDWPCFAKYYVTFPLGAVPPGKVIVSASLVLHQFGGSGDPGAAPRSLIQVFTVADGWSEGTINWNNAPLALENVSRAWVDPWSGEPIAWPGVPWTWDVGRAVAQAYAGGKPLRLALYSSDVDYHTGKHFSTSDAGEWNRLARPTLLVQWGDP